MFKFPNKAALVEYTSGTAPKEGLHTVECDESFYNEKIEYSFKDGALLRITNPKIELIKRDDINTLAELDSVVSPVNKNMIVVSKDESTFDKTTWYTYNVNVWVLMGEYLGKEIKRMVSGRDTRAEVIAADVDYTIPLEFTLGKQELSIYVEGTKLSSTDFVEVGADGVLSSKVQFKNAIMVGSEIEYVREVNTNMTTEPTYQIVQQKIQDDTITRQRTEYLKIFGMVYGGTIQDCTLRDPAKIYWCDVNKKFYKPSFLKNSIVPIMTGNVTVVDGKTFVASASTEHVAPFPAWYAFDGAADKFWHNVDNGSVISGANTQWLKIDMGVQTEFSHIVLRGRPGFGVQYPNSYKIQGSNDNTAWTDLYTVVNEDHKPVLNEDIITVSGDYRYIRIYVTGVQGTLLYGGCVAISSFIIVSNAGTSLWTVADDEWSLVNFEIKKPYEIVCYNTQIAPIPVKHRDWTRAEIAIFRKDIGWAARGTMYDTDGECFIYSVYNTSVGITRLTYLADKSNILMHTTAPHSTYPDMVFASVILYFD